MTRKTRDKTAPKYRALDMTEHALKVVIRTIDRHAGEGYAKAHPELISAFMTTAAANFATLTEREIAEAEQVTTINVKTGEVTAQIAAYGRLVADPQLKTTSKGTQMAMASMAVPLPCSQADDGTATMWLSVLAFGRQADALAKHHKGELVSVAGNMQVSQWTGQNGETRQGWQVIADSVISARTARPGGKKGQQGQATDALNRAKQQAGNDDPYGDNIPF